MYLQIPTSRGQDIPSSGVLRVGGWIFNGLLLLCWFFCIHHTWTQKCGQSLTDSTQARCPAWLALVKERRETSTEGWEIMFTVSVQSFFFFFPTSALWWLLNSRDADQKVPGCKWFEPWWKEMYLCIKRSNSPEEDIASGHVTPTPRDLAAANQFPAHCSDDQQSSTGSREKGQHMWKHFWALSISQLWQISKLASQTKQEQTT